MIQKYIVLVNQDIVKKYYIANRFYARKITIDDIRTAMRRYFYHEFCDKAIRIKKVKNEKQ